MPEQEWKSVKLTKVDSQVEDMIGAGMVTNTRFLREVRHIFEPMLVRSKYLSVIGLWCISFFEKHEEAPGSIIQDLYNDAVREGMNKDMAEAIGLFLSRLSEKAEHGEFDKPNVDHMLERAETYFQERSLEALAEGIRSRLTRRDVKEASSLVLQYHAPRRPASIGTNPFTDVDLIRSAFENSDDILFEMPGALGELVNENLIREGFVGIMGPEKRGKTFTLIELAMRANARRRRVAFFGLGDMSERQMALRFAIYISRRNNRAKYCRSLLVPCLDCAYNQDDSCGKKKRQCDRALRLPAGKRAVIPNDYTPCSECADSGVDFVPRIIYTERPAIEALTWAEAIELNRAWYELRSNRVEFKLACYPNSTQNIAGIDEQLRRWELEDGFVADVVFMDYADILAPEPGDERKENRHKQDGNWRAARALSQKWHNLVITATQTDADSYERGLLLPQNFSEDKRKFGHCTVMLGLNQLIPEKSAGIMRWNVVMGREIDFVPTETVTTLQSLAEGRPCLDSFWTERSAPEDNSE